MSSLKGVSLKQGFYIALPAIHGTAAIASLVICFYCNVRDISHQARVPVALPTPPNFPVSKEILFLAGYPWAEDAEFVTHTWNPFALIMTFQWLTAGFALRNVATIAWDGVISIVWCVWLTIGYTLYLTWSFAGFGGAFCVAMFATVTVCYLASLLLCLASVGPPSLGFGSKHQNYDSVPTRDHKETPIPSAGAQMWTSTDGRLWIIPRAIRHLKRPYDTLANDVAGPNTLSLDTEIFWGVIYRYAEYCVTAPLLFISVVCLLYVDAPAWLFLVSYWLILVCNLFGIILHYNYLVGLGKASHTKKREVSPGMVWLEWIARLFASGPWSDASSAIWYNLQGAWFSILVPVSGLVYLTRSILLNTNIPEIALAMIWNLLLSYLMFGIVPSFVYIFNVGKKSLPWLLDILNISAKFPLPVIIIIGFITRPVSMRPCLS